MAAPLAPWEPALAEEAELDRAYWEYEPPDTEPADD